MGTHKPTLGAGVVSHAFPPGQLPQGATVGGKIIVVLLTGAAFLWERHFQPKSLSFYFSSTISQLFPSYFPVQTHFFPKLFPSSNSFFSKLFPSSNSFLFPSYFPVQTNFFQVISQLFPSYFPVQTQFFFQVISQLFPSYFPVQTNFFPSYFLVQTHFFSKLFPSYFQVISQFKLIFFQVISQFKLIFFQVISKFKLIFFQVISQFKLIFFPSYFPVISKLFPSSNSFFFLLFSHAGSSRQGLPFPPSEPVPLPWGVLLDVTPAQHSHPSCPSLGAAPTKNPISASHPNLNFILSLIFPAFWAPGQGLQEAQGFLSVYFIIHQILDPQQAFNLPMDML
ncbi:uncharacterized protein LOC117007064 [Catharus ustulatus]|uniref:uncharacterized protein LOC117007064 n=1 Tax=Catharus ustulatus TaxID=91951 RepID=UPI001409F251|nr:uncharacterized protein LOC117007064 [Catharus ustulatus]